MAKTRRKPWFRAWDEMLSDHKMRDLSDAQWGIWLKLLCLANQQSQRGLIVIKNSSRSAISTLASLLHTRSDRLATNLRLFSDKNMVEYELQEKSGYVLISSWNKRQFASDDVTERVLKHQKNKRLTKRYRTEQSRAESPPSDLCDSSISSYSIDQDDQPATSPGRARPPESPSTEKDTANERIRPTLRITEEMIERFLKKNGEQELRDLMECAKGCFNNGQDEQVNAALWHTVTFYEPKDGPTSAKVYFRQELEERL